MKKWLKELDRILRGEATRLPALRTGTIEVPVAGLLIVLTLLGMLYGVCMGCFRLIQTWGTADAWQGWAQVGASALKVPLLFLATVVVTFPSLYVFNALVGSRLTLASLLRLLVAALAVLLAVLASFGTIVAFFAFTTTSYPFMQLLNVAVFAISGVLGLAFLLQTLHRLSLLEPAESSAEASDSPALPAQPTPEQSPDPSGPPPVPPISQPALGAVQRTPGHAPSDKVRTIFRIWIVVFALVGAQMSWVLRPYIGHPNTTFEFFRERKSNFFEAVANSMGRLVAGDNDRGRGGGWSR